jgi:hypothetical protein
MKIRSDARSLVIAWERVTTRAKPTDRTIERLICAVLDKARTNDGMPELREADPE